MSLQTILDDNTTQKTVYITVYQVDVNGTPTTIHISNGDVLFTTAVTYHPNRIIGDIKVKESLSLDGNPNVSFGVIYLDNLDGAISDFVRYAWEGRSVFVNIGESGDANTGFSTAFAGTIEKIDAKDQHTLVLKVRSRSEELNKPITDTLLGGTTENADKLIPLSLGEVFNITPLLIDPATLTYQVHNGAIESIIEVRDNGIPLIDRGASCTGFTSGYIDDLTNGKFTLCGQPYGEITASVQGAAFDYLDTHGECRVGNLIAYIGKTYGGLVNDDFGVNGTDDLADFDDTYTQSVSCYVDSKENILPLLDKIADSVGGQVYFNRYGLLKLKVFKKNIFLYTDTITTITEKDIILGSFKLIQIVDVKAAVKLHYSKNYTVQRDLQTSIPQEHKDKFSQEWQEAVKTDATTMTKYNRTGEVDAKETLLINQTDAETEAQRLLDMYKNKGMVFEFKCMPSLMTVEVGDYIKFDTDYEYMNYGGAANYGQILSVDMNWTTREATIKVLVLFLWTLTES